jgi:hypothetical protein
LNHSHTTQSFEAPAVAPQSTVRSRATLSIAMRNPFVLGT